MIKIYRWKNKYFFLHNCMIDDIPSHIERVLSYWEESNTDIEIQRQAMIQAVNSHTAYKILDEDNNLKLCLYFIKKEQCSQVICAWFDCKLVVAILLYYGRCHTVYNCFYFYPHIINDVIPFSFIVDDYSIMRYYSHKQPLTFNIYHKKCRDIINKYLPDLKEI